MMAQHVAHMNYARLRHPAGDPRVAGFVDNVPKVNAIAERSAGFVWRLQDDAARVSDSVTFEAVDDDPLIAASLSVWESADHLQFFVQKTLHGAFLRRREEWFEPNTGPNYVIWPVHVGHLPTLSEGKERLALLATDGATEDAYDFKYLAVRSAGVALQ